LNSKGKNRVDYLVIGAGIIGMSVARELKSRFPEADIVVLEKEADVAFHSSGRNSGVLHAGFYYTADSLKARFTRDGNRQMREYCHANGLQINETKKVVVARNEEEIPALFELERRGRTNGVEVSIIDEKELAEIDPNIKSHRHALFSPSTATVDPVEVTGAVRNELQEKGVRFYFGESYASRIDGNTIKTARGSIFYSDRLINAAGLYADRVARDFGFSGRYTIIPFKGIYLKYTGKDNPVTTNVYPVPDLKNPFLGVHFTVTVDGHVKIGPTSVPAFWRENYEGMSRFRPAETAAILTREAKLFLRNSFGFRSLAIEEVRKYNRRYFTSLAASMVHELDARGFNQWGRPGIRAQLLDVTTDELVMDFVIEGDGASVHILNAVSPAFTCAFPFTKYVVDNYVL